MIPGWSQTSAEWEGTVESLSAIRSVIALDMRGHGESEKPEYGYRVSRLAQDLLETINKLELPKVDLMGHSMGCAVIWAYIDLYGQDHIEQLVLVDQAPCMFPRAEWSSEERSEFGCFYGSSADVDELAAGTLGCVDLDSTVAEVLHFKFSGAVVALYRGRKFQISKALGGLLRDTAFGDWRDVIHFHEFDVAP